MSSILKKEADQMRVEDDDIWARILESREPRHITMVAANDL